MKRRKTSVGDHQLVIRIDCDLLNHQTPLLIQHFILSLILDFWAYPHLSGLFVNIFIVTAFPQYGPFLY